MNYFLKSIAVLVLFLTTSFGFAQESNISGKIIDNEFNEPLAFASIQVKDTNFSTNSEFDGSYIISLNPGKYTLIFSFPGYKSIEVKDVMVEGDHGISLDITLDAHILRSEKITSSADGKNE